jgi:hypothetical protein
MGRQVLRWLLVALVIALAAGPGFGADPVVNSWLGGLGNWSNSAKWSLGVAPNGSTDILISGGIVLQNVTVTISAELINQGVLLGGPFISLTNAGTLKNFGILSNDANLANQFGATLINMQDAELTGSGLRNSGDLSNAGLLTVRVLDDSGTIVNTGTLAISGALGGEAKILYGGTITNYGVLTNMPVDAGSGIPIFVMAGGSLINMQGAMLNAQGLLVNLGLLTNKGTLTSTDSLNNEAKGALTNSGTLTNTGKLRNQGGGTLTNTGELVNQGVLINSGGSILDNDPGGMLTNGFRMANNGTLDNTAGATLTNNFIMDNNRTLNNNGTLTNTSVLDNNAGAELINAGGSINNEGTLTNAGFLANNSFFDGSVLLYGTLLNSGTLTNTAGAILFNLAGNTLNNFGGTIENRGLLDNDGELDSFFGKISNAGTLSNTVNGVLTNSIGSTLNNLFGATLTNGGAIQNGGTLVNANQATLTNLGTLVSQGQLTNLGNLQNTGILSNSGTLINRPGGTITNDGVMTNTLTLTNEAGAALTNNESLDNTGILTNNGAIVNTRFATILNSGSLTNNGSLTNDAGGGGENAALSNVGTLTNNGTLINNGVLDSDGILVNNGDLTNSTGATLASQGMFQSNAGSNLINAVFGNMSLTQIQVGGDFRNDGTVTMTGANPLLVTPTGMLGGTGTVNGNVVNQGKMKPGDSPGEFLINGDYEQTATGTFLEEIAGAGPGQNGELLVSGDISLDGLLDVILLNGFTPAPGDSWVVIDYGGSRDGEFAAENFPALPPGLTWDVDYDDSGRQVVLDVAGPAEPASTPEPSTWVLLASVAVAILWWRKRHARSLVSGFMGRQARQA